MSEAEQRIREHHATTMAHITTRAEKFQDQQVRQLQTYLLMEQAAQLARIADHLEKSTRSHAD